MESREVESAFIFIFYFCQGNQNVSDLNYSSLLGGNKSGGGSLITGAHTDGLVSWQEIVPDTAAGIVVYNKIHCHSNNCMVFYWTCLICCF